MAKKKVEVVYDYSEQSRVVEGDFGPIRTTTESERGEWPACFGARVFFPKAIADHDGKLQCSCGRHILYQVTTSKRAWPDDGRTMIRVIKR